MPYQLVLFPKLQELLGRNGDVLGSTNVLGMAENMMAKGAVAALTELSNHVNDTANAVVDDGDEGDEDG